MIKVLLVEDQQLIRFAFRQLLAGSEDVSEVREAEDAECGLAIAREWAPDVVLLDLVMPGIGGLGAIERFRRHHPRSKILILTAHGDGPFPRRAIAEGAHGFLTKGSSFDEVINAIRHVCKGGKYIQSEVAQRLAMDAIEGKQESPFDVLSSRELQIVLMIAEGKRNNDIADSLHVSPKTVSTYRTRALEKLNVSSTGALVSMAMQYGLLEQNPA
jgi:two-component system invasion response regulator UvrY